MISCASAPKFQRRGSFDQTKALVHFYRPWTFRGSIGGDHKVFVDDALVASLGLGTFKSVEIASGTHRIHQSVTIAGAFSKEEFTVESGKEYFVRSNPGRYPNLSRPFYADGRKADDERCPYEGTSAGPERMEETRKALDTRAQARVCRPGLMFVKEEFALAEISDLSRSE